MENYYLVFYIDFNDAKGRELAKLLDTTERKTHLMSFVTKRSMKEFVDEYTSGMREYKMLKPIS